MNITATADQLAALKIHQDSHFRKKTFSCVWSCRKNSSWKMHPCGLCEERFSSNDDLKKHLERHESQLLRENEIKHELVEQDSDQYSDAGSLILDCVKEEEQLQGQQEESQGGGDETFMCSKCSYKTSNKVKFNHHMNQMHLNKIKCDHCPKTFPTKAYLANHVRKRHVKDEENQKLPEDELFCRTAKQHGQRKKTLYKCLNCTFENPIRSDMYRHIRGIHRKLLDELYKSKGMVMDDAAYHKCTKCSFKTLRINSLNHHIKRVHEKIIEGPKLFSSDHKFHERKSTSDTLMCSKCAFKTVNQDRFNRHMKVMHLNKYKCDLCSKRYPSKGSLVYHKREKHVKDEEKPILPEDEFLRLTMKNPDKRTGKHYECLKCSCKTTSRTHIYQHIRGVHRKLLEELYKSKGMVMDDAAYYKCTKCFFKTLRLNSLNLHIKIAHTKIRDYICDLCKKAFSVKRNLGRHIKNTHLSAELSELHKCSICTYKTTWKWSLKKHFNVIHVKIRKFSCDLCQMQFSRKDHLRDHIEKHLEKNLLCCNRGRNCSFRTTNKQEFQRHVLRVHKKVKGFSCEICGKWYASYSGLFWHKKDHVMV